jgi:DNA-binding CsgD family transcriptional regulator/predicted transcriptional regulator
LGLGRLDTLAEEGLMDAHAFDVRDQDRMQLLLDGSAMSAWELLRRYGGSLSAARIAVYLGVEEAEAQRALVRLVGAGLVESLAPRGRRRQTVFAHLGGSIVVRYQDGDAEDLRLLKEWRDKVRHSVAWIARGAGGRDAAKGVTRSIRMRAHLTERDAEELASRIDDLCAFLRLLESKYRGEHALEHFRCNHALEIEIAPLARLVAAAPGVTVSAIGGGEAVDSADDEEGRSALSPRERDVAVGIVAGRARSEIAARLGITPSTVATLTKRLYRKLGVHSRTELTQRLVGRGGRA